VRDVEEEWIAECLCIEAGDPTRSGLSARECEREKAAVQLE